MDGLSWSPQQERALAGIEAWLREPPTVGNQVRKLFGLAGTGKSTLAKYINDMLGGNALAAAYTGKAASVMARKGLPQATTIHHLIYVPAGDGKQKVRELEAELAMLEKVEEKSIGLAKRLTAVRRALDEARKNSGPQFVLKSHDESDLAGADLCIIDEVSMVNDRMAEDLLSFGVRLLVMGDPAQLPPVRGTGYFMSGQPHDLLTEIHRQARDNPIIDIAHRVREGRFIEYGDYGEAAKVVRRIDAEEAVQHQQVLCGTNKKRQAINARHRQIDGRKSLYPEAGERLRCMRNDRQAGLLNGTIWNVVEDTPEPDDNARTVFLRIEPEEGGTAIGVSAEARIFIDEADKAPFGGQHDQQFTWGYCLTTHAAQGSQWDSVLVFDDWSNVESHKQWLYTAVTRAAERLTLVR